MQKYDSQLANVLDKVAPKFRVSNSKAYEIKIG